MIRTLIALSALSVTAALAAPAFAEESIKVDITGKAPAAQYATIARAARAVCRPPAGMDIYNIYSTSDCLKTTIAAAIEKTGDAALSQYAANREAFLTLASN